MRRDLRDRVGPGTNRPVSASPCTGPRVREGECSDSEVHGWSGAEQLAARAGRWSATHRRIAIAVGSPSWILALLLGSAIGVEEIKDEDSGVGEAREADRAVAEAFPRQPEETVLVQSRSGVTADQPEFRAVVDDAVSQLESTENVIDVESPYSAGTEGGISQDGTSALITFEIPDPGDDADVTAEDLVERRLRRSPRSARPIPISGSRSSVTPAPARRSASRSRTTSRRPR